MNVSFVRNYDSAQTESILIEKVVGRPDDLRVGLRNFELEQFWD